MPVVTSRACLLVLVGGLAGLTSLVSTPAQAGLLTPLLSLARPQLELSLARQCLSYSAGDDPQLQSAMAKPCEALARPIAACLITQTEASGRALAVIGELIGGRFGEASEVVVKRCLAITLGLPGETFAGVPLRRLAEAHGLRLGPMLAGPVLSGVAPPNAVPPARSSVIPPPGSTATMQPSKPKPP